MQSFECNDEPTVKKYLVEEALFNHNINLAKTKLFFDSNGNIIGFSSMYNDMMQIGRKKRRKHKLTELPSFKYYPAIKLHYMGVDSRHRNNGYGEEILISVLSSAKELSETTGCLFLTVESLKSAVDFYLKYEFQRLSNNGQYMNMFFNLNEL
ncbi:GNAT family N-acetyltransferase [Paenibacillus sp. J5C2022]|uniref:GNAT family N-acetyltransferase n=1 Tax=Paenibacillus sp. J5C2022 TaxID=2977129 RepID=UPI0021D29BCC|nr:GNAT family N-acetyltransferase [Paenibacillus sp. J5C2022]